MSSIDDDFASLSEAQTAALPLLLALLGAASVEHNIADVQAVIGLFVRNPRLLSESIRLGTETMSDKGDELERRVRHPRPTVVDDDTQDPEAT